MDLSNRRRSFMADYLRMEIRAKSLDEGDRMEARLYWAETELSALAKRQGDVEEMCALMKLHEAGLDLSMLGRQRDVSRQNAGQLAERLFLINMNWGRVDALACELRGALYGERGWRRERGLPMAEPRFTRRELDEATKNIREARSWHELANQVRYETQFTSYGPRREQFGAGEVSGRLSAAAVVGYVNWHKALHRMDALDSFSALRGATVRKLPEGVQWAFHNYSRLVQADFEKSRRFLVEALEMVNERAVQRHSEVEHIFLMPKGRYAAASLLPMPAPWYMPEEVKAITEYANDQGDPMWRDNFRRLLRGGKVSDRHQTHSREVRAPMPASGRGR